MTVQIIVQGKGGVGKTLVASMIAEYCQRAGATGIIDMDPKNGSLSEFEQMKTAKVAVSDGANFDAADDLFSEILESKPSHSWVIDTAGESFDSVLEYLSDEVMLAELAEAGHTVYCHVVVVGGASKTASALSLNKAVEAFKGTGINVILWNNDYFGEVGAGDAGNVIDILQADLVGTVNLKTRSRLIRSHFETKYVEKLTLAEVESSWERVRRNRIIAVYNDVFSQLNAISAATAPGGESATG